MNQVKTDCVIMITKIRNVLFEVVVKKNGKEKVSMKNGAVAVAIHVIRNDKN